MLGINPVAHATPEKAQPANQGIASRLELRAFFIWDKCEYSEQFIKERTPRFCALTPVIRQPATGIDDVAAEDVP